ncbi:hypothetical protein LSM04_006108 [Trypanosoma melophagium]|uniref:uncharacterized protein n=1 Tax=Trypanosoma melophagium TaxID=715481 RepID=UPI00351A0CE9|nr:hypothetical protein LSM04_006108 [Trypanosoma melophagium]
MAEDTLHTYASDLFGVIEINAAEVIPIPSCVETLFSLNTNLSHEKAEMIVKGTVLRTLENKSYRNALSVLRDLILRLQLTYRKKYLMMDVGANTPISSLTENPTVVGLFK